MLKVPSYSSLGITGPLITDAIGFSKNNLYDMQVFGNSTHMDTAAGAPASLTQFSTQETREVSI